MIAALGDQRNADAQRSQQTRPTLRLRTARSGLQYAVCRRCVTHALPSSSVMPSPALPDVAACRDEGVRARHRPVAPRSVIWPEPAKRIAPAMCALGARLRRWRTALAAWHRARWRCRCSVGHPVLPALGGGGFAFPRDEMAVLAQQMRSASAVSKAAATRASPRPAARSMLRFRRQSAQACWRAASAAQRAPRSRSRAAGSASAPRGYSRPKAPRYRGGRRQRQHLFHRQVTGIAPGCALRVCIRLAQRYGNAGLLQIHRDAQADQAAADDKGGTWRGGRRGEACVFHLVVTIIYCIRFGSQPEIFSVTTAYQDTLAGRLPRRHHPVHAKP